jgi:hypothetical protein
LIVVQNLSPNQAYLRLLQIGTSQSFPLISSRVGDCFDMGLVTVELDQGERIGFLSGRGFNPVFALIEAAWMISGRNDLQSLQNVIRNFGKFSDDGNTLNGAYGYRLRHEFNVDQIDAAVIELNRTADSRRVVLSIYGAQDVGSNSNDIPCNTQVLLRIVEGRLSMTVINRSNDLWLGVPYNWFAFRCIQEHIALRLGIPAGIQRHISNCMHLYTRDLEMATGVAESNISQTVKFVEKNASAFDTHSFLANVGVILQRPRDAVIGSAQLDALFHRYDCYRDANKRSDVAPPGSQGSVSILDVSFDEWMAARLRNKENIVTPFKLLTNPDTNTHLAVQRWFMSEGVEAIAVGTKRVSVKVTPLLPQLLQNGLPPGVTVDYQAEAAEDLAQRIVLEFIFGTLDPMLSQTEIGEKFKSKLLEVRRQTGLIEGTLSARDASEEYLALIFSDIL